MPKAYRTRRKKTGVRAARRPRTCGVCISVPVALKAAIASEVERQDISMNDLVVAMVAGAYEFPFEPGGGRHGVPAADKQMVLLRMPTELKRRLQHDALRRQTNLTDRIVRLVAVELGVELRVPRPTRLTPFGGGRRTP